MGYLNFSGFGTIDNAINIDNAIKYFKSASLQEHPAAQYYLGICFENGFGVNKIESIALYWYKKAADKILQLHNTLSEIFINLELLTI